MIPGCEYNPFFSAPNHCLDDRLKTGKATQADGGAVARATILGRIADGDPLAMNALIDQYGDLVWSLAQRYFGASPIAQEDVTSPGGRRPALQHTFGSIA